MLPGAETVFFPANADPDAIVDGFKSFGGHRRPLRGAERLLLFHRVDGLLQRFLDGALMLGFEDLSAAGIDDHFLDPVLPW